MSNFKLKFKLKQHTPIIHFQHDQHGASLRATELKPKLDRFLLSKLGEENYPPTEEEKEKTDNFYNIGIRIAEEKGWLIGTGEHPALDYKISIENTKGNNGKGEIQYFYFESRIKYEDQENVKKLIKKKLELPNLTIVAPSSYFANNDKRNNNEFDKMSIGILWTGHISISIIVFDLELKEYIKTGFSSFISIENFGNRQSKGFGSYSEININENNFKSNLNEFFPFIKKVKTNSKNIYKDIDIIYKSLKNNAGSDISKIRDYFAEKDIEWEKKFITKKIIKGNNYSKNNVKYVRILLGLAELHDYQKFNKKVKIKHLKTGETDIERFQSPIMFKIFDNNIYVVVKNKDFDKITGEWFNFYIGENIDKAIVKEKLQVPNDFDIINFLNENL